MINSHYIPQFILRGFCEDNKIMYCDLDNCEVQSRNTRSVFAEKGYYPEQTEIDLCKKIEYDFSVILHSKLEHAGSSLVLDEDELFILKKYLIVSSIRYQYEYTANELELLDKLGDSYNIDMVKSLNEILHVENIDELFDLVSSGMRVETIESLMTGERLDEPDLNIHLWAEAKDIVNSYVIIVKASGSERFVIPDTGRGVFEGPRSREKYFDLINSGNPNLLPYSLLLSPRDYTIHPLTKDIAIISMSPYFKLFTNKMHWAMRLSLPPGFSVSDLIGFGSMNDINPPDVRCRNGKKEYCYRVNRLNKEDTSFFNCLFLAQAKHHFAYSSVKDISRSLEKIKEYSDRDFSFIK